MTIDARGAAQIHTATVVGERALALEVRPARARVVFVNRVFWPDHSATSQLLTDLVGSWAADGGPARVVTTTACTGADVAPFGAHVTVDRLPPPRLSRQSLPGRAMADAWFLWRVRKHLARTLRPGDIVVAKTDPPMLAPALASVVHRRGASLVVWNQDIFPEVAVELGVLGRSGWFARRLLRWRNRTWRAARCNIVLGERMQAHVEGCGVAADALRVIPNWADEALHPVPAAQNALRKAWGLEGCFVVAYSGNMGRAHDYLTLLEAAKALRSDTRIRFVIIGGGHLHERLAAESAALGNIVFKPFQPRESLSESLSVGDVHLITLQPELEGLIVPSKVYGVMAVGRPLIMIGAADGEVGQMAARHGIGLTVTPGDGQGLADAIQGMAMAPDHARRMGDRARIALEQGYSRAQALQAWHRVLSEAVSEVQRNAS